MFLEMHWANKKVWKHWHTVQCPSHARQLHEH